MYTTGSLGFMLQGVSQQPQRVQPDGHTVEQINTLPDPNTGLSSRPGSDIQALFEDLPEAEAHRTVIIGNTTLRVSTSEGSVYVLGYDGTEYNMLDPDDLAGYFGPDMAYYSKTEDGVSTVYCVNRQTPVQTQASTSEFGTQWGHVFALGGEYSKTYSINLTYADGTVATGTYTTPDADAVDAALDIRPENILSELRTSLVADSDYKVNTFTTLVRGTQLYISYATTDFSITVEDQSGNTVLRGGKGRVPTFADVPKYARHRDAIKVSGEQGTLNDDVWLVFISDTTSTIGEGLGGSGVWTESVDPSDVIAFNKDTMPHALVLDGNDITITQPDWQERRVGNEEVNPLPSFVGSPIKDIAGFQGRIAVISGPNAVMTRTDNNLDFFRRTATTVLATDPIDIRAAGEDDSVMEWIIPYDNNLIIAAKDGQFFISGVNRITNANAAMPRSSNFEMSIIARPVVAGQTVMLPYSARAFSGVNEMLPTEEGTANTLDTINNVTRKYIRGEIVSMAASANSNTLAVLTDDDARNIYVYTFLWENNTKAQSAWHTWTLPNPVEHLFIRDSTVFVWTRQGTATTLLSIKLDRPEEPEIGFHITADFKGLVDSTEPIVLSRADYRFVGLDDGDVYSAGRAITPISVVPTGDAYTYTLPSGVGETLIAGVPISVEILPNRPIPKDWRGNRKDSETCIVQKYLIDYEQSGTIEVYMSSEYFDEVLVADSRIIPAADDPTDSFGTAVRSGTLEVPWNEDSKLSQLIIRSDSLQPTSIVEIRWAGQVFRGRT
jgi:hypothetical protein